MSSKSWIWRAVITVVVVGLLVAAGFWIYQLGYRNGVVAASTKEGFMPRAFGHFGFFYDEDDDFYMPCEGGRGFFSGDDDDFIKPRQGKGGFYKDKDFKYPNKDLYKKKFYDQSYPYKSNFYFSPFSFFIKLVVFAVFLWLIYKFITMFTQGKGWQMSFTRFEDGDETGKKK
jgi:hypothetical protein